MPNDDNELIKGEITRADDCLRSASMLIKEGLFADAISRAYYCVFHAAKAVLFTKGITERSHKGVVSQFGEYFVKTGLLEKEFGRILRREKEDRELSDYEVMTIFDESQVETRIEEAESFLKMAKRYTKKVRTNK